MRKIELKDIEMAADRLKGRIQKTQVSYSGNCSAWVGSEVYLKLENEQKTGSFKIRGALNKILSLTKEDQANGIVAASAGNHAQGVAYAATSVGAKAFVVMPENTPLVKIEATKGYGATVILHGEVFDESYAYARELEQKEGYTFVHPYQDSEVIAGQGTLGLEIMDQLQEFDSIVVPIGGGGLISGIATAVKSVRPQVKIYGVVPAHFPGMLNLYKSLQMPKEFIRTIAEGTAVKTPSREMFDTYISPLVDDIVSVSEGHIAEAMVFLLERGKTLVEGSAALSLAAAARSDLHLGKKTCLLMCGGNIDLNLVSKVIEKGLSHAGRIAWISVIASDIPGTLNHLTAAIARNRGNVMEVRHDRFGPHLSLRETRIDLLVETSSKEHIQEIVKAIQEQPGIRVISSC